MREDKLEYFILLITIQLSCCYVLAQPLSNRNFFNENWKSRKYNYPAFVTHQKLKTIESPDAIIIINTQDTVAPVLSTQFGANTNFRAGSDQPLRSAMYKGIINSMRFPAGSGSNIYFFDGRIPSKFNEYIDKKGVVKNIKPINGVDSKSMTPTIFVNFKKNINGNATVVVNYLYARY